MVGKVRRVITKARARRKAVTRRAVRTVRRVRRSTARTVRRARRR